MSFQCLASWAGDNGETYMSLLDTKLPQLGEEARPRYRCAVSTLSFIQGSMLSTKIFGKFYAGVKKLGRFTNEIFFSSFQNALAFFTPG